MNGKCKPDLLLLALTSFAIPFFVRFRFRRVKFIYSEKATQFCEISTLLLTTVHTVKSNVDISQNFVAFLEYMNFMYYLDLSYVTFAQEFLPS